MRRFLSPGCALLAATCRRGVIAGLAVVLGACGSGGGSGPAPGGGSNTRDSSLARGALLYGGALPAASCTTGDNLEGGRNFRVETLSRVDGKSIVFQLFEPDVIDCDGGNPLILEGHGYSGSRQTSEDGGGLFIGAPINELTARGYAVISIDQRGHGESGGTIRVMDPDFEGQDLIAIVDWAEQHLDFMARDNRGNLKLGAMGGSYGGGYQMLLWAIDPDRRLDAIVPEITWNDLDFSLNPGEVVKSGWALTLAAPGDANTRLGQDSIIRATLIEGAAQGRFPEEMRDFFTYHSPAYFCGESREIPLGTAADTSGFLLDPILQLLPVTAGGELFVNTPPIAGAPPRVDALIFQGQRDDLFNFNEAFANFQCLQRGGGDVRLLTYPFGHHFLQPNAGLLIESALSQSLPLDRACGPVDASQAALAWFDEKIRGIGNADDVITTGGDFCFSLTQGDAVQLPEVPVGGQDFDIALPGGLPAVVTIAQPVPTLVPLTTIDESVNSVVGIPTAQIQLSRGSAALDEACIDNPLPVLALGECDVTVFVGLAVARAGAPVPLIPDVIDEQVLPLRGIGSHEVELVGVAERLNPGDQLFLALLGLQDGFALTTSRDPLTPLVTVSGRVKVPLVNAAPADAASETGS